MQSRFSRPGRKALRWPCSGALPLLVSFCLLGPAQVGCESWHAARLYRSGSTALGQGDSQAAVADLERAAALRPRSSEIQNHLGIAYEDMGRTDSALAAFQRAVELDCTNSAAAQNLAAARDAQPAAEGLNR